MTKIERHMAYKVLYIEDQKTFGSIKTELETGGFFEVEVWDPKSIELIEEKTKDVDLMVVDFRLTESSTIVDGPAFAQAIRTKKSETQKDIPVVLFSVEENITDYYKDFTSQDLFDFSIPKGVYLDNSKKYNKRLLSVINSYKIIKESKNDLDKILDINKEFRESNLDYRIEFSLSKELYAEDVYAFSNFILQNVIRSLGVLIGEDILSARLGVSTQSKDWEQLKEKINELRYTGVFSDSYNRWWANSLSAWFKKNDESNRSLRRLSAIDRTESLKKITGLSELTPLERIEKQGYKAKSDKFWTICKETKLPIDYIDGFELYERDLFTWQEPEYLCFLGKSSKKYSKSIKPSDLKRINEIENKLRG